MAEVSSDFQVETLKKKPTLVRRYTMAGSDYSSRVLNWPTVSTAWDDMRPKTISLKLANGDGGLNYLRSDKTLMEAESQICLGYELPPKAFKFSGGNFVTDSVALADDLGASPVVYGIFMSDDGLILYILDSTVARVMQYDLSTAWDILTAVYRSSLDISAYSTVAYGLHFSADGTKFYVYNESGGLYQILTFVMSTPWDVTTGVKIADDFNVQSYVSVPSVKSFAWSPDGLHFYFMNAGTNNVYVVPISTAWTLPVGGSGTLSYWDTASAGIISGKAIWVTETGKRLYITSTQDDKIHLVDMTTAWDITTSEYSGRGVYVQTETPTPRCLYMPVDASSFYLGINIGGLIQRYATFRGHSIANAAASGGSYTITEDTTPYAVVFGYKGRSMFAVGGDNQTVYQYSLSTEWDVSTASYATSYYDLVLGYDARSMFLRDDGADLFILDYTTSIVYKYHMSTPLNLYYAAAAGSKDLSAQGTGLQGIAFNKTGTKMWVSSNASGNTIYQYSLSTAWDITTATYDSKSFSDSATPLNATPCISVSEDGGKLIALNTGATDTFVSYAFGTEDDITTLSADGETFDTALTTPSALAPGNNGGYLYVLDASDATVYRYSAQDTEIPPATECMEIFTGKAKGIKFRKEVCTLSLVDKFQQLSDRTMGTSDDPVSYVDSNYLPSDIAWWAVTSYGGMSTDTTSANPDIDMTSFNEWAGIFTADNISVQGLFDGQKVTEVLRKIARSTHSGIFVHQNKLHFRRFGIIDTATSSLGAGEIKDLALSFDMTDVSNRQFVSGGFDVTSDAYAFTVQQEDTASVNSFGAKEARIKDKNFWYADSGSAVNLAQRKIYDNAKPDDAMDIETTLVVLPRTIGETLHVQDAFHGIAGDYRILSNKINIDTGKIAVKVDKALIVNPFILDASTLDNTLEVLS